MNIQEYWRRVNETAATLPDPVYVVSLDNREKGTVAGVISECDRKLAARLIIDRTHRVASDEEIAEYLEQQAEQRRLIAEAEYRRKQQFALPEELAALVKLAVGQESQRKGRAQQ